MKKNDKEDKRFLIIANWAQGEALSGGDRIFMELSKRWRKKRKITFCVSEEGWKMCERTGLSGELHEIWGATLTNNLGICLNYLYRTFSSIIQALKTYVDDINIVYSTSDFWPDFLPAFILKMRKKTIFWIAGFYLFAPAPFQKDFPYKGWKWIIGVLYYFAQKPAYCFVTQFADVVFVTSVPDIKKFVNKSRGQDKVVLIRGGVDVLPSREYLNSNEIIDFKDKYYDACFVGRLHCQKGVLELIDIWNLVSRKRQGAKLAIIGEGPLEADMRKKIIDCGIKDNVEMLGFQDGQPKYEVFKKSRIVLHPATYDSGGMAAAEAMAWGLPGVSFDLEALKTYYPKGMVKTTCFDLEKFADNIINLLTNKQDYDRLRQEAVTLIQEKWDWDKRADEIYELAGMGELFI